MHIVIYTFYVAVNYAKNTGSCGFRVSSRNGLYVDHCAAIRSLSRFVGQASP